MQKFIQINSQVSKVIIILLLLSLIYGCTNEPPLTGRAVEEIYEHSAQELLKKPERSYHKTINAIIERDPANYNTLVLRDLKLAKEQKINTIFVSIPYKNINSKLTIFSGGESPIEEEFSTKYFADSITFLKNKGLSAGISIYFEHPVSKKDLEQVSQLVRKWALIAEENNVEYFEPFSTNNTLEYYNSEEIKEISDKLLKESKGFKGKLVSDMEETDYIISTIKPSQGETVGSFKTRLINEYGLKFSGICSKGKKVIQEIPSDLTFNPEYYEAYKEASKELKCFSGFRINSYVSLEKKDEILKILLS